VQHTGIARSHGLATCGSNCSSCNAPQAEAGVDKAAGAIKDAAKGGPGGKLQGDAKSALGSAKQVFRFAVVSPRIHSRMSADTASRRMLSGYSRRSTPIRYHDAISHTPGGSNTESYSALRLRRTY